MTTFFGLDNRVLLPPFFPVQRNSDGIFGLMLQKSTWHGTAFLPSVLLHAPPPRTFAARCDLDGCRRLAARDVSSPVSSGSMPTRACHDEARSFGSDDYLQWLGSLKPHRV